MFDASVLDRDLIMSEDFNNSFKEFRNEVTEEYDRLENRYSELDSLYNQNVNNINNILNQLGVLQTQLYEYQNALINPDNLTQFIIEDFRNGNNIENDLRAYEITLSSPTDKIRPMVYINNYNKIESYADVSIPLNYMASVAGRNYIEYETEGDIAYIKNNSSQSFWYETVRFNESVDYLNFQYETGIVADLTLDLKEITKLNKIILRPFSSYPIRIISMSYYDLLEAKEIFFDDVKNVFIEGVFNHSFPEIYTNRLRVRLQQIHYEKDNNEYVYNIGLYSIRLLYNSYAVSTQFMSKPIPLKEYLLVDYYSLDTEDTGNIAYTVVEYFDDARGQERFFKRDILTLNITRIVQEPIQPHLVNGKYIFATRYPFKGLILYMNGAALIPTMEYFLYDNQNVHIFNFEPEGTYTADYMLSDNVVRSAGSGNNNIKYIRLMGYSRNAIRPAAISGYTLKIRYKKQDAL